MWFQMVTKLLTITSNTINIINNRINRISVQTECHMIKFIEFVEKMDWIIFPIQSIITQFITVFHPRRLHPITITNHHHNHHSIQYHQHHQLHQHRTGGDHISPKFHLIKLMLKTLNWLTQVPIWKYIKCVHLLLF